MHILHEDTTDVVGLTLSLPLIASDETASISEVPQEVEEVKYRTYLIVDDSELCRKVVRHRLQRYNIHIEEAVDGVEAVEKVRAMSRDKGCVYDLIVMDNSMPQLNGPKAAKKIREMGYTGVIYGLTGSQVKTESDEFERHGADKVLCKPLKVEDFDTIVSGTI
jgi:CheY-like chemotaxis protein